MKHRLWLCSGIASLFCLIDWLHLRASMCQNLEWWTKPSFFPRNLKTRNARLCQIRSSRCSAFAGMYMENVSRQISSRNPNRARKLILFSPLFSSVGKCLPSTLWCIAKSQSCFVILLAFPQCRRSFRPTVWCTS